MRRRSSSARRRALSNPTERIEAVPADLVKWTDGRGLIGTGTPWAPVPYKAIASLVDTSHAGAGILPDVENLRASSATVAVAVARQAAADGVADALDDPVDAVQEAMWKAVYP